MANQPSVFQQPAYKPLTDTELRASPVGALSLNAMVPVEFDEVALSYTGEDLTGVVYKLATVTVCTLTLGYTSGNLTSVVRS